jgi:hypothetical protein
MNSLSECNTILSKYLRDIFKIHLSINDHDINL